MILAELRKFDIKAKAVLWTYEQSHNTLKAQKKKKTPAPWQAFQK